MKISKNYNKTKNGVIRRNSSASEYVFLEGSDFKKEIIIHEFKKAKGRKPQSQEMNLIMSSGYFNPNEW